jgi:hypothetical protein
LIGRHHYFQEVIRYRFVWQFLLFFYLRPGEFKID